MTDLTPIEMRDMVEAMKARDERIALIGQTIDIENELRNSPTWVYIRHRAELEWYEALRGLATAAPHDQNRIRQLQGKAAIRDNIETWFKELTSAAQAAEQDIDAEEGRLPEDR